MDTDTIVVVFTTSVVLYVFWLSCRVISFALLASQRDERIAVRHPILTTLYMLHWQ